MKSASAYKIKKNIFIEGYAKTTDGVSTLDGPVFTAEDSEFATLGENILDALADAGRIIPHRTDWKQMEKEDLLLQAAKMKTWSAMMKKSISVNIYQQDNQITFIPYRFGGTSGPNKGYHRLEDKKIICETHDLETLGRALIEAFERCEE